MTKTTRWILAVVVFLLTWSVGSVFVTFVLVFSGLPEEFNGLIALLCGLFFGYLILTNKETVKDGSVKE